MNRCKRSIRFLEMRLVNLLGDTWVGRFGICCFTLRSNSSIAGFCYSAPTIWIGWRALWSTSPVAHWFMLESPLSKLLRRFPPRSFSRGSPIKPAASGMVLRFTLSLASPMTSTYFGKRVSWTGLVDLLLRQILALWNSYGVIGETHWVQRELLGVLFKFNFENPRDGAEAEAEAEAEGSQLLLELGSFDWLPPETLAQHQMNVEIGHWTRGDANRKSKITTFVVADGCSFWRVVVYGPLFQNVKHCWIMEERSFHRFIPNCRMILLAGFRIAWRETDPTIKTIVADVAIDFDSIARILSRASCCILGLLLSAFDDIYAGFSVSCWANGDVFGDRRWIGKIRGYQKAIDRWWGETFPKNLGFGLWQSSHIAANG